VKSNVAVLLQLKPGKEKITKLCSSANQVYVETFALLLRCSKDQHCLARVEPVASDATLVRNWLKLMRED
jgi:hypothetical protein